MDHDILIKTILDNNGIIHGGYMRAWVSAGHPVNEGWEDIDCIFENNKIAFKAVSELQKILKDSCPKIDLKWRHRSYYDDFYCNCWYFDGSLNLIEPAKMRFSFEEMEKMNQNKIAMCIKNFDLNNYQPHRIKKMINYGWKIVNFDGQEIQNIGSFLNEE
jgi:hypothetical protein